MTPAHRPGIARLMRGLFCGLAILAEFSAGHAQDVKDPDAAIRLGKRLFHDLRLSNPGARFDASCRSCHIPPGAPEAARNFTDVLPRSLLPSSARGAKLTTRRNTPTLVDAAALPVYYWDGRYRDLKETIVAEFTSAHLGWLPDEREYALDEIHNMILWDQGEQNLAAGPYLHEFDAAYGVDLETLDRDGAIDMVATALAEFIGELNSTRDTPYDRFVATNALPSDPAELLAAVEQRDVGERLSLPDGFTSDALAGLKIFFRTQGEHAGACVACHVPPRFTDDAFHNTGVAQLDFEGLHDAGTFARIALPDLTKRPVQQLGLPPDADDPSRADLGHWNYAEDPEIAFAAFRTPSLRGLALSDPYMHNGAYATLEDAIRQKITAARMARDGELRNPSPALAAIRLDESDIPLLVAFLKTLD